MELQRLVEEASRRREGSRGEGDKVEGRRKRVEKRRRRGLKERENRPSTRVPGELEGIGGHDYSHWPIMSCRPLVRT